MIHQLADVQSTVIGEGTNVWQFAVVLPKAKIGRDCNICANAFVENDVVVGDRVTVKCGVQLWDGLRIEDDVFIGPNVTFTNDRHPRSKVYPEKFLQTVVKKGASIGANATILPGVTIGEGAMIGAGAVVVRDVPAHATVVGNPAQIVGYTNAQKAKFMPAEISVDTQLALTSLARLVEIPTFRDMRGILNVVECERLLQFSVSRVFYTYGVQTKEVRGEHAHKKCHQFLVAVHGNLKVLVDDGVHRDDIVLNRPSVGLHIPPGVWGCQYQHSPDCVLMVLASEPYDDADYIRDYNEFLEYVRNMAEREM